uniref:Uncharacterized protein n=1 Tax=Arundo donax TaxID=35708 RepID=A0A0A9BZY9_ARUDO
MVIVASPFAVAVADLCAAITAIEIFNFLTPQPCAGTTASTPTPPLDIAALAVFLPLAATTVALHAAVGLIYRHLHRAGPAAAGAGAGARRISELVAFMCAAVGFLEILLLVQPAGGVDGGAQARALGMAAVDALPAAATATFFLGMILIIAHIRAGGEGGGGAVADNRPVPAPGVELLRKMALGAAAVLVSLMAMSLSTKC